VKKITALAFALACLLAVTGMAFADPTLDTPDTDELTIAELFATPDQSAKIGCAPVVGEDGEMVAQFSNSCGNCGPSPACDGKARGSWCWEAGQGWGTCDLYLGIQCSDGSGWDCNCYHSGEYIP
jgi:hypothetical protein